MSNAKIKAVNGSTVRTVELVILGFLAITACRPSEKAAQGALIAVSQGLAGYPGQNPEATKNYLQKLNFTSDSAFDGPVTCAPDDNCGAASVHLRIMPEQNAHRDDMSAALDPASAGGFIVAMIINMDSTYTFGPFNLAPRDTVYWWAGATKSSAKRFAFYRISRATGAAQGVAFAANAGYCPSSGARTIPAVHINHTPECQTQSLYSSASEANAQRSLYHLAGNSMLAAAMLHTQGLWISCSLGCCEAGGSRPSAF